MTDYLIDANVLIQAKNLHYGFDFCPAFWDWLVEQNRTGRIASIRRSPMNCMPERTNWPTGLLRGVRDSS